MEQVVCSTLSRYRIKMQVKDIIQALEELMPLNLQESYDNCGLQVGDRTQEISSALLCVDLTEAVVQEAIDLGAGLIITHHPPLFKGLKCIGTSSYIERAIVKAIQNNIVIYTAHTNADNASNGLNYLLAEDFALENVQTLSPLDEHSGNGAGIIGDLKEEIELNTFLQQVKKYFACEKLSYSKSEVKRIKRVALCGGAGAFLWRSAKTLGADIFITGEAKYNDYFDVEERPILATVGHYESEVIATKLFRKVISKKFPNFVLYISKLNSNPILSI